METAPRRCGLCSRWSPPLAAELARWEAYQSGRTRRKARKPKGFCASIASDDPAWPRDATYLLHPRWRTMRRAGTTLPRRPPGEPPGRPYRRGTRSADRRRAGGWRPGGRPARRHPARSPAGHFVCAGRSPIRRVQKIGARLQKPLRMLHFSQNGARQ